MKHNISNRIYLENILCNVFIEHFLVQHYLPDTKLRSHPHGFMH